MSSLGHVLPPPRAISAVAAVLAAILATGGTARAADSTYTSIRSEDCTAPPAAVAKDFAARDLGVEECPAPEGWRLLFVASDANSWIELRRDGLAWSAEQAVVYENPIGLFPNIGDAPVVEWRLDAGGRPTALIFRVTAQDPNDVEAAVSRLFVVRLEEDQACLLGRAATNDAARTLADSPQGCANGAAPR
jgi:hypothetical protein